MSHRVHVQARASASSVGAGWGNPSRGKAFSNKQDNSERLPDYPVLKIKNTNSSKGEEAKKRQQLVTPLHHLPCSGGLQPPQMKLQTDPRGARQNLDNTRQFN